jgi:trans-aconitate 2-methyltransferase
VSPSGWREESDIVTDTPRSTGDWSPQDYLQFEDERTRAACDLLAAVPLGRPAKVVDVGCGPGNSTELLLSRFPQAQVAGLDSSPAMLAEARLRLPELAFAEADASRWIPEADVQLVFANAVYQWVPNRLAQLPRVLAALPAGGVLAVQMPDNLDQPTHLLMQAVADEGPWAERLAGARREPLGSARDWCDALAPEAARVDIWRTTYHHRLADPEAIVDFVRSTGLRPYLEPLSTAERAAFLADYTARVAKAYPPLAGGGVLLPYPRLFIVARR